MKAASSACLLASLLLTAAPAAAQIYRSGDLPPPAQPQAQPFPPPNAVPTESTAPSIPTTPAPPETGVLQLPAETVAPAAEPIPPEPALPEASTTPFETLPPDGPGEDEAGQAIEAAPVEEPEPYVPPAMYAVSLRGINKVSAKTETFDAVLGSATGFGNLEVIARACWQAPPGEQPENASLLEISERKPGEAPERLFMGWMFASSPSLSALEHPVYDITVVKCLPLDEAEALP